MNKTKIVSAIYFDLYGTDLGGRSGRNDHYLYSMNSIMNNNANYIIYTNDKNKVDSFFKSNYPDKLDKFTSIQYNLYDNIYKNDINRIKNLEHTRVSFRCIELQYNKLFWLNLNNNNCDYIYWIDAGLCYSGLLPDKYLKTKTGNYNDSYYGSDIFTNKFIDNLNFYCYDKVLVCAKENIKNYWDSSLPSKYFIEHPRLDYHIIGGLFGGNNNKVKELCDKFHEIVKLLLKNESFLYSEEQILSCLFFNYKQLFTSETFDIWWHENNVSGHVGKLDGIKLLQNNKSFYKILEKFISN